jgi:uncharacterized membrane protein HdeD (DUF308 family)
MVLGGLQVLLGILAVASPFVAGAAATVFVGTLLVFAGLVGMYHTAIARSFGQGVWGMATSILAVTFGILVLLEPVIALVSLTLVVGLYFMLGGVSALVLAVRMRRTRGWEWVLVNGIVTLVLAMLMLGGWPLSAFWALGTLIGIDIILNGMASVMIGSALRQGRKNR